MAMSYRGYNQVYRLDPVRCGSGGVSGYGVLCSPDGETGRFLKNTGVLMNLMDPGWLRTDLGGPNAPNPVESVIPGALVPVLLEDETCGKFFHAQDYRES